MKYCHNCGLSVGEKATFCATCGVLLPVEVGAAAPGPAAPSPAPAETGGEPSAVAADRPVCRLCGQGESGSDPDGVCSVCRAEIALFVALEPEESPDVSLATNETVAGRERVTIVNAIYSALADDGTCPECGAMDGRETSDIASAASWAPNPRCSNPAGCRCMVFFEHERLCAGEERRFVDFAAGRGMPVTAATVASFHDEQRRLREEVDRRLDNASGLLREARTLEKSDPRGAVGLYRRAIEGLMECSESPLDEYRVRHDLPLAFNRLTMVLKGMGQDAEALDEIDRVASWGILERDDCGRKSDREAIRNRARRLRERREAVVTA
ncbi:MAG: hypothetical protein ACXVP1_00970 [Thermoleophilia bacterium]